MAQTNRPSQAEKAAAEAKRKSASANKSGTKKPAVKPVEKKTTDGFQIPFRFITSTICIALFVLFLVMLFNPAGALVKLFYGIVLGQIPVNWVRASNFLARCMQAASLERPAA